MTWEPTTAIRNKLQPSVTLEGRRVVSNQENSIPGPPKWPIWHQQGVVAFKPSPFERKSSEPSALFALTLDPKTAYFLLVTRGILQCGLLSMAATR